MAVGRCPRQRRSVRPEAVGHGVPARCRPPPTCTFPTHTSPLPAGGAGRGRARTRTRDVPRGHGRLACAVLTSWSTVWSRTVGGIVAVRRRVALLALLLGRAPAPLLDLAAARVGVQVAVHHVVAAPRLRAACARVPGLMPQSGGEQLGDLRGGAVLRRDRSGDHPVGQVGARVGAAAHPQADGRVACREDLGVVVRVVADGEPGHTGGLLPR